jgi:hypothetical protein
MIFYKLDKEEVLEKKDLNYEFLSDCENVLEIDDNLVSFNPLGKILWDKYKRENFIFYTTDEVINDLHKMQNIKSILKNKFQLNYKNKTEQKNNHYVYDDGKNQNRIFYFEEDGKIYIYKVFENHDVYEKYLNKGNFNKESFKLNAKLFKIY